MRAFARFGCYYYQHQRYYQQKDIGAISLSLEPKPQLCNRNYTLPLDVSSLISIPDDRESDTIKAIDS